MKRWHPFTWIAGLFCLSLCAPLRAMTLGGVTQGSTVSGVVTFSATEYPGQTASVEFDIDGVRASPVIIAPPYTFQWDSSTIYDGPVKVQAIACDSSGNVLATTAVTFTASNQLWVKGGTIALVSPDPSQVLSGTVQFNVTASRTVQPSENLQGDPAIAYVPWFIDGVLEQVYPNNSGFGLTFDTTTLSNGPHLLSVAARTGKTNGQCNLPVAALQTWINVQNGTPSTAAPLPPVYPILTRTGYPHFGKDGSILSTYDAQRSVFTRSMFTSDLFLASAQGAAQANAAGFNTWETGCWLPTAGYTSLAKYEQDYSAIVMPRFQTAKANGASVLCSGDDLMSAASMQWFATSAWSHDAVSYAFKNLQSMGNVIGVEGADEVNAKWGPTPFPATSWPLASEHGIPLTILDDLSRTIRTNASTSFAWPVMGLSTAAVFKNWCDPRVATHATVYYTDLSGEYCANRKFFAADEAPSMLKIANSFVPQVPTGFPILYEISICSAFPGDWLVGRPGLSPNEITAQAMLTVILGGAGIRAFGGSNGSACDSGGWQALASSYNLLKCIEPYILQQEVPATNLGPHIFTAARSGANGNMLIALNSLECSQTKTVDLSRYIQASTGSITRYRISGAQVSTASLPVAAQDTVTFAPNETVIWVFTDEATAMPTASIVWPPPYAQVGGSTSVQVNVTGADQISLQVNGVTVQQSTSGSGNFTLDATSLPAGTWQSLSILAHNSAGTSIARTAFIYNPAAVVSNGPAVANVVVPAASVDNAPATQNVTTPPLVAPTPSVAAPSLMPPAPSVTPPPLAPPAPPTTTPPLIPSASTPSLLDAFIRARAAKYGPTTQPN